VYLLFVRTIPIWGGKFCKLLSRKILYCEKKLRDRGVCGTEEISTEEKKLWVVWKI
jgi:hypothetical protein